MASKSRALRRAALVGSIFFIALVTLVARSEHTAPRFDWRIASSPREVAETLLNVVLFMPFGAALCALHRSAVTTAVLGFTLSLAVELLQRFVIPGREGELQDLIANTLGALAGWLLTRTIARQRDA